MFFPRLRNQAKWAFVFLIFVFGGGFIFLGVGSGGLDIGQLVRDAFGNQGGSGTSVSAAQKEVQQRPFSPVARRQLADALEKKGRIDEAITSWSEYVRLRPQGRRSPSASRPARARAGRPLLPRRAARLARPVGRGHRFGVRPIPVGEARAGDRAESDRAGAFDEGRGAAAAGLDQVPDGGDEGGRDLQGARQAAADRSAGSLLTRPGRGHPPPDDCGDRRLRATAQIQAGSLDRRADSRADQDPPADGSGCGRLRLDSARTGRRPPRQATGVR